MYARSSPLPPPSPMTADSCAPDSLLSPAVFVISLAFCYQVKFCDASSNTVISYHNDLNYVYIAAVLCKKSFSNFQQLQTVVEEEGWGGGVLSPPPSLPVTAAAGRGTGLPDPSKLSRPLSLKLTAPRRPFSAPKIWPGATFTGTCKGKQCYCRHFGDFLTP